MVAVIQGKDRGPQSVYLDEGRHDRVSRMVANALGNKGSLPRFFAFVEDRTFERFGSLTSGSDSESISRLDHAFGRSGARLALRDLAHSSPATLLHPIDTYLEAWKKVQEHLPWFSENPTAAHVLALTLLTPHQELWKVLPLKQPGVLRKDMLVAPPTLGPERGGPQSYEEVVYGLGSKTWQPYQESADEVAVVWQRGRVDFLRGGDKQRSVSLYLSARAHEFFYNIFGNAFFQRIEFALDFKLNDQPNWIDIAPEGAFLEHGSELFDLDGSHWPLEWKKAETQNDAGLEQEANFVGDVLAPQLPPEPFADEVDPDYPIDLQYSTEMKWESTDDAPFFPIQEENSRDGLSYADVPTWKMTDEMLTHPLHPFESLRLAHRLGLLTLETPNLDGVKTDITARFIDHYHLKHLTPSDGTAYHILKQRGIPEEQPYYLNAVDFHLFELFRIYARETFPERGPDRSSLGVLATLAQPWLFPTRNTLEAFSGHRVRKARTGSWRFSKARSVELELTNAEAYGVARCLEQVASFYYEEDQPSPVEFGGRERLSIPTGLAIIERALAKVNKARQGTDDVNLRALGEELRRELVAEALADEVPAQPEDDATEKGSGRSGAKRPYRRRS